jgi:uncharacterized protein (DUF2141 family)
MKSKITLLMILPFVFFNYELHAQSCEIGTDHNACKNEEVVYILSFGFDPCGSLTYTDADWNVVGGEFVDAGGFPGDFEGAVRVKWTDDGEKRLSVEVTWENSNPGGGGCPFGRSGTVFDELTVDFWSAPPVELSTDLEGNNICADNEVLLECNASWGADSKFKDWQYSQYPYRGFITFESTLSPSTTFTFTEDLPGEFLLSPVYFRVKLRPCEDSSPSELSFSNTTHATFTPPVPVLTDANIEEIAPTTECGSDGGFKIQDLRYSDGTPWFGNSLKLSISWGGGTGGDDRTLPQNATLPYKFSGFKAGDYDLKMESEGSQCSSESISFTIPDGPDIELEIGPVVGVSCHNENDGIENDGSITVEVSNGKAPYDYQIKKPGQTSFTTAKENGGDSYTYGSLTAGNYDVRVIDANGCTSNEQNTPVGTPSPLVISNPTPSDVDCHGNATGEISIDTEGGTSPYDYQIKESDEDDFRTVEAEGGESYTYGSLTAGSYDVRVIDANGCTSNEKNTPVGTPNPLGISTSANPVKCSGGTDGSITVSASEGTGPYTYSIDNGDFGTTREFTGLQAGEYTLAVKDANNCSTSKKETVGTPKQLKIADPTPSDVDCHGNATGEISIDTEGGTSPYDYQIKKPGQTSFTTAKENGGDSYTYGSLTAGSYDVRVIDANGCTSNEKNTPVGTPNPLGISTSANPVKCSGGTDGSITVSASEGTGPYTYSIDNGDFGTTREFTGLQAGEYTLAVKDANNCSTSKKETVGTPNPLGISTSANPVKCSGGTDGSITVSASEGTGPYTYSIDNGDFGTTREFTGLQAGEYTLAVKDANNCSTSKKETVGTPKQLKIADPTPSDVDCHGNATGEISIDTEGGTSPYDYQIKKSGQTSFATAKENGGESFTYDSLTAGSYDVRVIDANGCTSNERDTTVGTPSPLVITVPTPSDVDCHGNATGEISIDTEGGTSPYDYQIKESDEDDFRTVEAEGGNSYTYELLTAGSYDVRVIDANGCNSNTRDTIVTEPQPLSISFTDRHDETCAQMNGSVVARASGGIADYKYQWYDS